MSHVEVDIEAELARLGEKRLELGEAHDRVLEDIRHAVSAARKRGVSMTRVAELLRIDRTQLYRTYLPS